MAGIRKSSGTNVTPTTRMRRASGSNVALTIAKRRVSGAWVDVFVATPKLTNTNKSHYAYKSTGQATVRFRLAQAGKLRVSINGGTYDEITPYDEWLEPEDATLAIPSLYSARLTNVTGSTSKLRSYSGATQVAYGTAYQMNTTRDFELVSGTTPGSSATITGTLQIIRISDSVVVASCTLFLYAEYTL